MGRWLYGKGRRLQGSCWHLRILLYPGPALLSQKDKARTVFLPRLEQAHGAQGAVIYTAWLGNSLLLHSQAHRNPFSLSSRCQVPH